MVDGPTGRPPVLGETDRSIAPRDAGWTSSIQGEPRGLLESVGEVRGVPCDLLLLGRGQVPGEDVGGGPGEARGAMGVGDRQGHLGRSQTDPTGEARADFLGDGTGQDAVVDRDQDSSLFPTPDGEGTGVEALGKVGGGGQTGPCGIAHQWHGIRGGDVDPRDTDWNEEGWSRIEDGRDEPNP